MQIIGTPPGVIWSYLVICKRMINETDKESAFRTMVSLSEAKLVANKYESMGFTVTIFNMDVSELVYTTNPLSSQIFATEEFNEELF